MDVMLTVKGKEYKIKTEQYVNVDPQYLDKEFAEQASRYCWLASLRACSGDELRLAEAAMDLVEAQITSGLRLEASGKTTETSLKHEVRMKPEFQKALAQYNGVAYVCDQLSAMVKAMEHKRDMLQQLGAARRQEMELYVPKRKAGKPSGADGS